MALQHSLLLTQYCCRNIVNYIGYGHDKPGPTDAEVTAKPTMAAYIVTENLECGTLRSKVLNQVCRCPACIVRIFCIIVPIFSCGIKGARSSYCSPRAVLCFSRLSRLAVANVWYMLQMVNPSKSLYSTEQAVQWLTEIADALHYMHTLTPAVSLSPARTGPHVYELPHISPT